MGLLNIYSSISKLRPHITYRFCAAISPFGSADMTNNDVVNFAIKNITFPTFGITNDTKRLFGNTQVSFPTIKFGEREMSITFEETDDMSVFNTLSNFYGYTPYANESLPLISIRITQFEESMNTVVDEKTYVCRIKQFDFPTFNNNEYGSPISLKASFYVLYSTSDEKSLKNISYDDNGKIKHKETHGGFNTIFSDYMENVAFEEDIDDLKHNPAYRTKHFNEKYTEIDNKMAALQETILRQVLVSHEYAMKNDASYKNEFETFMKSYKGESGAAAVNAFLGIDFNTDTEIDNVIGRISTALDMDQNKVLDKALMDYSELNADKKLLREDELQYAGIDTTGSNIMSPIYDIEQNAREGSFGKNHVLRTDEQVAKVVNEKTNIKNIETRSRELGVDFTTLGVWLSQKQSKSIHDINVYNETFTDADIAEIKELEKTLPNSIKDTFAHNYQYIYEFGGKLGKDVYSLSNNNGTEKDNHYGNGKVNGIDCSGLWRYYNRSETGKDLGNIGTTGITTKLSSDENYTKVTDGQFKTGDTFVTSSDHVGVFVGYTKNGDLLFMESTGSDTGIGTTLKVRKKTDNWVSKDKMNVFRRKK